MALKKTASAVLSKFLVLVFRCQKSACSFFTHLQSTLVCLAVVLSFTLPKMCSEEKQMCCTETVFAWNHRCRWFLHVLRYRCRKVSCDLIHGCKFYFTAIYQYLSINNLIMSFHATTHSWHTDRLLSWCETRHPKQRKQQTHKYFLKQDVGRW